MSCDPSEQQKCLKLCEALRSSIIDLSCVKTDHGTRRYIPRYANIDTIPQYSVCTQGTRHIDVQVVHSNTLVVNRGTDTVLISSRAQGV